MVMAICGATSAASSGDAAQAVKVIAARANQVQLWCAIRENVVRIVLSGAVRGWVRGRIAPRNWNHALWA